MLHAQLPMHGFHRVDEHRRCAMAGQSEIQFLHVCSRAVSILMWLLYLCNLQAVFQQHTRLSLWMLRDILQNESTFVIARDGDQVLVHFPVKCSFFIRLSLSNGCMFARVTSAIPYSKYSVANWGKACVYRIFTLHQITCEWLLRSFLPILGAGAGAC